MVEDPVNVHTTPTQNRSLGSVDCTFQLRQLAPLPVRRSSRYALRLTQTYSPCIETLRTL